MSRLFLSHSSNDNVAAIGFKQWLGTIGWLDKDVFLDLDSIGAGERWKNALNKANTRCEGVILLASPEALASSECLAEVRKAESDGKEIIVVLLRDLQFDDRRLDSYKDRQIVDLGAPPQTHVEAIDYRGERQEVHFNPAALARIKDYLAKRGITPDHFPWPPQEKPDSEPFPGLSAFTENDAGIFFGRDADIVRGLDRLRFLRRNGRPRLLVIQAASGAGKSSYLRAGLWPRLNRDPDFAPLAVLRPAQGCLSGPEGLGRKLAARLSRPARPISPGEIHAQLLMPDAAVAATHFTRLMSLASTQALEHRRIGDPEAPAPALLIALDQAEELFGPDDKAESDRFLSLLAHLMHAPPAGVESFCLLTIRSDGAERLFRSLADLDLDVPETLPLLPLPQSAYRDVIRKPLEVLAQRGQRLTLNPELTDRLVGDASGADALPLLAFTISHLYREFGARGNLTLEQYESIGGVAGAIEMALKQALAKPGDMPAIPAGREEQLTLLRAAFIPWLARVEPDTGLPMRRVARFDEIPNSCRSMVERLIKARLLVADRRSEADVVDIAHESLLRQWSALTSWLHAEGDNLRLLEDVERAAGEWSRRGRSNTWIDHRGERLYLAETLATRSDFEGRFNQLLLDYLAACRARESPAFRRAGVDLLPLGLERAGLDTRGFAWPPPHDRNRPPYPGLRPFTAEDAAIFFGRDRDILRALERVRSLVETGSEKLFVILGPSGIGKSSLLRAGLCPRLARCSPEFTLVEVIGADAHNLPKELARGLCDAFERLGIRCEQNQFLEALSVGASAFSQFLDGLGFAKTGKDGCLGPTIILPIDQLEYCFRYGRPSEQLWTLLAAVSASNSPILVIASMRSEYAGPLGFHLSNTPQELFNLAPMESDQYRDVIVEPAKACGVKIDPALTSRLLDDLPSGGHLRSWDGDEKFDWPLLSGDKLPLLQYTLNRMWLSREHPVGRGANDEPRVVGLSEYEAMGGLRGALNTNADLILKDLAGQGLEGTVETVFRALTAGTSVADAIRRPTPFGELVALADGNREAVRRVVDAFRAPGCNFLRPNLDPSDPKEPADEIYIEIHEGLIRQWKKLSGWLAKEASSAQNWRRLRDNVAANHLVSGKELTDLLAWLNKDTPSAQWARRYGGDFSAAVALVRASERSEAAKRWRKIITAIAIVIALGAAFLGGSFVSRF